MVITGKDESLRVFIVSNRVEKGQGLVILTEFDFANKRK